MKNTKSTIVTQIMTWDCSNFLGRYLKSKYGRNSDQYLSYENILGCMRHFRVNKAQNKAKRGAKNTKSTIVTQIMTWDCSNFLGMYLKSQSIVETVISTYHMRI